MITGSRIRIFPLESVHLVGVGVEDGDEFEKIKKEKNIQKRKKIAQNQKYRNKPSEPLYLSKFSRTQKKILNDSQTIQNR